MSMDMPKGLRNWGLLHGSERPSPNWKCGSLAAVSGILENKFKISSTYVNDRLALFLQSIETWGLKERAFYLVQDETARG